MISTELAQTQTPDIQSRLAELPELFRNGDPRQMEWDQVLDMFPEISQDTDTAVTVLDAFDADQIRIEFPPEADEEVDDIGFDELEKFGGEIESAMDLARTDDLIAMYLADTKVPLLTAREEVELAQKIEVGRNAEVSYKKRKSRDRQSEGAVLEQQMIETGMLAKDYLARANSKLVISIAKRYQYKGLPLIDLISFGNVGLTVAINKFDWRRGNKFSTHATWWIRQAITRGIADTAREIRMPVHQVDRFSRIQREKSRLTQRLGREPTMEELYNRIIELPGEKNLTLQYLKDLMQMSVLTSSLQEPRDDSTDSYETGDFVPDERVDIIGQVEGDELKELINRLLGCLSEKEQVIMRLRFGLIDGHEYGLEEIGQLYNVTRERIRQIEGNAKQKLIRRAAMLRVHDYI
jgi:RNA polymerase primary sigma factor